MITLQLEVSEVNIILNTIGKLPFEEVAKLIVKIKQQGDPQAQALAEAAAALEAAKAESPTE